MTQIFNNYKEHKVFDIIKANGFKKVLLRLKALGLGDAMMFKAVCLPALIEAVNKFSDIFVNIDIDVHNGQDVVFHKYQVYTGNLENYDAVFELEFPDNCFKWEGADTLTKPETCLRDELGLDYYHAPEYYGQDGYDYNRNGVLVGLHLFSTCYAGLNCPEDFARHLWQQLADNALIPFDTYIETPGGKNRYKPYDFETQNLQGVTPGVDKLFKVVKSCCGFASVSSGNFFLALDSMPPEKILFLQTIFRPVKLTRLPVHVVDAHAPYNSATEKVVQNWIDCIKGE